MNNVFSPEVDDESETEHIRSLLITHNFSLAARSITSLNRVFTGRERTADQTAQVS
jgi:hypothetical protein